MVLIFVAYSKTKRPVPKHYMLGVDPNDEVRETIINYVEEGCPDVDQVRFILSIFLFLCILFEANSFLFFFN
jgi:hypothetical protein